MNSLSQITDTILMVQPDHFAYNQETAGTNIFQNDPSFAGLTAKQIRIEAENEFKRMAGILRDNGINVLVLPSPKDAVTPDAVFPNNWFSHHSNNTLVLYPMLTPNRRAERQSENLLKLLGTVGLKPKVLDLTQQENKGDILEGTGSMVLDRVHNVAFAIEASRTTKELFLAWCREMQYKPFLFHAQTSPGHVIYHTNIFMYIGDDFAVYCPELIVDEAEQKLLEDTLKSLKKELITISHHQVMSFCGNILQAKSVTGGKKVILSQTAYAAYAPKQRTALSRHGELVIVSIPTIEKVAGGGARCMMAEIFRNK